MRRVTVAGAALLAASFSVSPADAQLIIVDDRPGTFINIAPIPEGGDGTGTPLNLNSASPIALVTVNTISNDVFNIGPGDPIVVNNNGGISYNNLADQNLSNTNGPLPNAAAFGGAQAFIPFWDDIDTTGDVYYREDNNDRLIVQWHEKGFEDAPDSETVTHQVQIFKQSPFRGPFIYAQYLYLDVEGARAASAASATIGYQNNGGAFNDVTWSFNTPAVFDDDVLSLVIPEPATALLLLIGGVFVRCRR